MAYANAFGSPPFLLLDGTWIALLMLASIDIVIGPLLTLLLVNKRKSKRELALDMSIIVIIQISALTYGLVQLEKERLIALVHYDGVFHLVPKNVLSEPVNESKSMVELTDYQAIALAMILEQDVMKYNQRNPNNSTPFLYAIENFQALDAKEIAKASFLYTNLPDDISQQYNQDYIFKVLVGEPLL